MLKRWMMHGVAVLMLVATSCAAGHSETEVRASARNSDGSISVSYFYDDLSPYGSWVEDPSYGWCWTPYDLSPGWRPYSNGYWVYSDFGWTWASYEPWGWATYHYGRWASTPAYGWIWVPGTDWAPAWVAWRLGDDWVGWAPLPPGASWRVSGSLSMGDEQRIPAPSWCFVERPRLGDGSLRFQLELAARNVTLLGTTHDVTRYGMGDRGPVNEGVDVALIERVNGGRVERVKLVDADESARSRGPSVGGGRMALFRPRIRPATPGTMPRTGPGPDEVASGDPEQRDKQREAERLALESSLARDRERLEREHEHELRAAPSAASREEIAGRQQLEIRAFEQQAAQARQIHEQRVSKKIVKPGHGRGPDRGEGAGAEGQDKQQNGKKKGGHGKG